MWPQGVDVTFDDGRDRRFDVVIGADGQHSHARELAFGPGSQFGVHLGYDVAAFELAGYPTARRRNLFLWPRLLHVVSSATPSRRQRPIRLAAVRSPALTSAGSKLGPGPRVQRKRRLRKRSDVGLRIRQMRACELHSRKIKQSARNTKA
jgi:2-polyprenyl-6-methoxyphenol hydroxylase-like FAD-dependent oxidoreductase